VKNRNRIFCLCLCTLVASCANPLKRKTPYWYNGYVYGTRAHDFFSEGKVTDALAFYKNALVQARTHDIPEQAAQYSFNIGRCFLELDKYDSATGYFEDSYKKFSLCGSDKQARQAAGYAALSFSAASAADSAFSWYARGAITPVKTDEKTFWLMVHGKLLWDRDHSKEALAYFDEAYDLYKNGKSWYGAARTRFLACRVYAYSGDYDEAKKLIDEALSLGNKTPLRFDRWRMLCAAASIYSCRNDGIKARWFLDRALQCLPDGIGQPSWELFLSCNKELFR
jgi:tetratricopeptide (TPR) repeat protein